MPGADQPMHPRRAVHARAPTPVHAHPCTAYVPLKATPGRATLQSTLALTVPTQFLAPASSASPTQATQTPAITASHSQRHLASLEPLNSFLVEPWSFSKQESRPSLTGTVTSPSLDFGRPPPRVDRATRWTILRFLAPTTSLTSCKTPRLIGVCYVTVVMPESSPPTSFPACARGLTNSGHPRRRSAHRRDRHDLPYAIDLLAGARSYLSAGESRHRDLCRGYCSKKPGTAD
jgi:hypothetical protein